MPSPAETRSSSAAPGLAAAAATALVLALAVSSGLYDPVGLALVSASGIAALTATLVARRDGPHSGIRAAAAILAVAIAASIVRDLLVRPGIAVDPAPLGFFRPLLGIIAGLTPIALPGANAAKLDGRVIQSLKADPFLLFQLDATSYPGHSGSALYDAGSGEVIGVVNMGLLKGTKDAAVGRPSGISFAVPIRYLQDLIRGVR